MIDAQEVKIQVDLLQLVQRDTQLKRVARTNGGEYAGPCPRCGGDDRFRVQLNRPANKRPTGQAWQCHQCHPRWGDVIGYVQDILGISDFQDALQWLAEYANLPPQEKKQPARKTQDSQVAGDDRRVAQATVQPDDQDIDQAVWVDACRVFVSECVRCLWSADGARALAYLHSRGLQDDVLKRWEIGFFPADSYGDPAAWGLPEDGKIFIPKGITIPCQDAAGLHYVKIRRPTGRPKYQMITGSEMWIYGGPTLRDVTTAFIFEGELDVLLAIGTEFSGCGYISLPAGQPMRKEYARFFETVQDMIVCMDNDERGQQAARRLTRMDGFTSAEALPMGKDLTEYHQGGGDVFEYLYAQVDRLGA